MIYLRCVAAKLRIDGTHTPTKRPACLSTRNHKAMDNSIDMPASGTSDERPLKAPTRLKIDGTQMATKLAASRKFIAHSASEATTETPAAM